VRALGLVLLGVPLGYLLRVVVGIARYHSYRRRIETGRF
jgi:uncharacterized integral membrane protein